MEKRINFKKEEEQTNEPMDDTGGFSPDMRDIERKVDSYPYTPRKPVPRASINEDSFIGKMIQREKGVLDQEKRQYAILEDSLRKHCEKLEALAYIASGEPQMAVGDVLEMVNDFRKEFMGNKEIEDAFTKMEQTILESTIDSFQGQQRQK